MHDQQDSFRRPHTRRSSRPRQRIPRTKNPRRERTQARDSGGVHESPLTMPLGRHLAVRRPGPLHLLQKCLRPSGTHTYNDPRAELNGPGCPQGPNLSIQSNRRRSQSQQRHRSSGVRMVLGRNDGAIRPGSRCRARHSCHSRGPPLPSTTSRIV